MNIMLYPMSYSMKNDYIKHNRKIIKLLEEEVQLRKTIVNLKKEINKLNSEKQKAKINPNDICSICLSNIQDNDDITKLNCNHYYHLKCILNLTMVTLRYNRCPNCRKEFSTPDNMIIYRRQVERIIEIQDEKNLLMRRNNILESRNNLLESRNNLYNRRMINNNLRVNVFDLDR